MQQQQPKVFYFFSMRSGPCVQLNNMLKQFPPLANSVEWVEFEKVDKRQLPQELKSVPSIYFNGRMFAGEQAFQWVSEQIRHMQQQMQQQQQQQQPQQPQQMQQRQPMQQQQQQSEFNARKQGEPEYLCEGDSCGAPIELTGGEKFSGMDNRQMDPRKVSLPGLYTSIDEVIQTPQPNSRTA